MTSVQYLEDIDTRIKWFEKKSIFSKKMYHRITLGVLISGSIVPILTLVIELAPLTIKVLISFFGIIVTLLSSILKLYKFHEDWISYRKTCEDLKREKNFYIMGIGEYSDSSKSFERFVVRCENISQEENIGWADIRMGANEFITSDI